MMTSTSPREAAAATPWYRRPRTVQPTVGFEERLACTLATLRAAAACSPAVLATSLSAEDMVIFHLIVREALPIAAFALDTGRLPRATLDLWRAVESRYGRPIERVSASAPSLRALAEAQRDSAIYESSAARHRCCDVRKTQPLREKLQGNACWVTGLRRAQSAGRASVFHHAHDHAFGLEKFNPIADWSDDDVWYFIDAEQIPVNRLYDEGYASIGCDPCTRPIRIDEHPRAGRWWWEAAASGTATECGIHVAAHANANASATQTRTP